MEDLRRTPPVPAFYNLDTHQLEPLQTKQAFIDFLDVIWDREGGRVFFSAHVSRKDPFRVYVKAWPDGEEKAVYENLTGPFKFVLSPDGERMVLQVMGPYAWPILGVYEWQTQKWTPLGQGHSPDWSVDGRSLLYLKIPGSLPTWLYEYSVVTDTSTQLLNEPVMEAVYTDDASQILVKTASQAKRCNVFQVWNRHKGSFNPYSLEDAKACKNKRIVQRELAAFPGHRFYLFKESLQGADDEEARLIVTDVWGGRLQSVPREDWDPLANAVEDTHLAMSDDPIYLLPADGAGGKHEIPQARFIRLHH